jgi:putative peptidoglycan lipid II flippase
LNNKTGQETSITSGVLRGGIAVGLAQGLFKLTSVIAVLVAGWFMSSDVYSAVYGVAFEVCVLSFALFSEETITPTFIPIFSSLKQTHGEKIAWQFSNIVLTLHLLLLALIAVVVMIFPEEVILLVTAWSEQSSPEQFHLATRTLRILAPAIVFFSICGTTYSILNAYKRFFIASVADVLWKLCLIIAILVGIGWAGLDWQVIAFGLLAGGVLKLAVHLFGLRREAKFIRPSFDINNPSLKEMLLLILPLLLGSLFARIRQIYNDVTVLSTLADPALIKANSFGRKLYLVVGAIAPIPISIAAFPFFCELASGNRERMGNFLTRTCRMMLSVFIPLSFVCVVLSEPFSLLVLHAGKFTLHEARWSALSMACYVLVLPAQSLEYVLMKALFAEKRTASATVAGIIFSLFSIMISYTGIVIFKAHGTQALVVVALGFVLARTLKVITLAMLLQKNMPFLPWRETILFLIRAIIAGIIAGGFAFAGMALWRVSGIVLPSKIALLVQLIIGSGTAILGFFVGSRIMHLSEPFVMLNWTYTRVKKYFDRS